MCVARTASRRRRQMRLDKRYRRKDIATLMRKAAQSSSKMKAMAARKG